MKHAWDDLVDARLGELDSLGRRRAIRTLDGRGPLFEFDGRTVTSFASNDYLGLSGHPKVVAAAKAATDRWGTGAGASRLVVGARPIHDALEDALAAWKQAARALLFPTGYAANLSVLQVFGRDARIVSDSLNHASIVDGCRLAHGEVVTYAHGDADQAAALVASAPGRVVVVTDTVFSMDGDVAPVVELSATCAATGALLVLDDAHAVLPVPAIDPEARVLRVGTLSKLLGSLGGFVAGPDKYIDLLINAARPFVFTTAPPPAAAAAGLASLQVLTSPEGANLIAKLAANVSAFAPSAVAPIVPIVLGAEEVAMAAAAKLLERGYLVPAIRPPTVPDGSSRLRVAFSAAHTPEQVAGLLEAIEEVLGCN